MTSVATDTHPSPHAAAATAHRLHTPDPSSGNRAPHAPTPAPAAWARSRRPPRAHAITGPGSRPPPPPYAPLRSATHAAQCPGFPGTPAQSASFATRRPRKGFRRWHRRSAPPQARLQARTDPRAERSFHAVAAARSAAGAPAAGADSDWPCCGAGAVWGRS